MAMATALLIILFIVPAVYATDYTVGGTSGWNTGVNYATWAAGETFFVGDRLVFTYGSLHSVDQVAVSDYNGCTTNNVLSSHSGGSTIIPLNSTGPMYFLCPTPGHCGQGMKLAVVVSTGSGAPSSSPPPPPPPASTTSPPSPSGATGNFYNMNILVLLVSVVLAPLLVLMG